MYVRSIDSRLKRMEDGRVGNNNNAYEEVQIIQNMFPLKTIGEITHFDQSLDDKNVTNTFMMYVKRIGGTNGTDNIKAILKRIFTNKLGTQCSWLGQRNNFKICDLLLITVIKDVVLSVHGNFQEMSFNKAVSKWFRLSKLRYQREQKHRHDLEANADNLSEENTDNPPEANADNPIERN